MMWPRPAAARTVACGIILGFSLNACSSLPGSGPRTGDIERGARPSAASDSAARNAVSGPYVLVNLDQEATRAVNHFVAVQTTEEPISLPRARPSGLTGPGDLLEVTIWEPNPDGTSLGGEKSGLHATARIGSDGTISVPYVGRIAAGGHTPAQIEATIAARLAHQSAGAQVAVLVTEDVTNAVIVQGDVAKPGRYAVVPRSSGLLDILAMAGGPLTSNRQSEVRITRGDTAVTRSLSTLVGGRALETDLAPGDRILVQPRHSYYYAFGAVGTPGEQPYDADNISLARTLARLNGLADNRADPAQVFIYRRQDADLTRRIAGTTPQQDATKVIYRLNLRDPAGFFISQQFPVLPDDLIYVSESPIAEAGKVFQIINGVSGIGAVPRNLGAPY